jgi:hypothetical protein
MTGFGGRVNPCMNSIRKEGVAMRIFKSFLMSVVGVGLLCSSLGLVVPEANAALKSLKNKIVTNKDLKQLILMLKDQNTMLKEQVTMLKDQIDNLPESEPCGVPPTWGGVIPGNERFVPTTFVDANGDPAAYCDRETGLVWEAVPSKADFVWGDVENSPANAKRHCLDRRVGTNGQKGWRLPSIPELASLVDLTSTRCTADHHCVPDGSPFEIDSTIYWSVSEVAGRPTMAWAVFYNSGGLSNRPKDDPRRAWCVRGAMQESVY